VVEEINLRVHIAALRRALGDGEKGQRYIVNVPQCGYSFIAPVHGDSVAQVVFDTLHAPQQNLPARLTRSSAAIRWWAVWSGKCPCAA
jgi:DNA-binding winged helix-turn-helix (wHTH) protein